MKKFLKRFFRIAYAILFVLSFFLLLNKLTGSRVQIAYDQETLLLGLTVLGMAVFPLVSELKIGGWFAIKQLRNKVKSVEDVQINREVIKHSDKLYFAYSGNRHKLIDPEIAKWIGSSKGVVQVDKKAFKGLNESFDYRSLSFLMVENRDCYVIINEKLAFYLSSWGMITKNGKKPEDFIERPTTEEFLRKYEVIV